MFSIENGKAKGVLGVKATAKEMRSRSGGVPPERRRYPRFDVDLPIQYKIDASTNRSARAMNLSEGGMLIHSTDQMEIGQHLKSKLIFMLGSEMDTIEGDAEVIWRDIYSNRAWGDHRCGVRFHGISPADQNRLKDFLANLA